MSPVTPSRRAHHHVLDRTQVQVLVGNLELGKVPTGKKKNQLIDVKACAV
jgi:hypothetical protein